jgi:hypothetical protein
MKAKVAKVIKKQPSLLSKSIQPILIVVTLCVVAYVAYKIYVAVQQGITYISLSLAVAEVVDDRSAKENLKRKGFTIDEQGRAHVKIKKVDTSSYVDKTQRYEVSDAKLTAVRL